MVAFVLRFPWIRSSRLLLLFRCAGKALAICRAACPAQAVPISNRPGQWTQAVPADPAATTLLLCSPARRDASRPLRLAELLRWSTESWHDAADRSHSRRATRDARS